MHSLSFFLASAQSNLRMVRRPYLVGSPPTNAYAVYTAYRVTISETSAAKLLQSCCKVLPVSGPHGKLQPSLHPQDRYMIVASEQPALQASPGSMQVFPSRICHSSVNVFTSTRGHSYAFRYITLPWSNPGTIQLLFDPCGNVTIFFT